jgi:hypothetical protein
MKINDIILEQKLKESFWDKLKNYAKSFGQQIDSGMSIDQIERRAEQDRNVKLLVNAFLTQWDNMRYSLQQAYGQDKVSDSMYEEILEKLVYNQINASVTSSKVRSAIETLLRNGDNINNKLSQDAAYTIITSGIASNISPSLGVKVDVLNRKLSKVGYGGTIPNGVPRVEGLIIPVIVMAYHYELNNNNGQRLIKANGQWHGMGKLKKSPQDQDFIDDRNFVLDNRTMLKNQNQGNLDIMAMQKLALNDPMQARRTAVMLKDPSKMEFSELSSEEIEIWQQQTRN